MDKTITFTVGIGLALMAICVVVTRSCSSKPPVKSAIDSINTATKKVLQGDITRLGAFTDSLAIKASLKEQHRLYGLLQLERKSHIEHIKELEAALKIKVTLIDSTVSQVNNSVLDSCNVWRHDRDTLRAIVESYRALSDSLFTLKSKQAQMLDIANREVALLANKVEDDSKKHKKEKRTATFIGVLSGIVGGAVLTIIGIQ